MMYSKYIAFAWLLLLLLAHRTSAQVTNSQLASARQNAQTYASNLSVLAKEPNNAGARTRLLGLFETQATIYNDILPGNNMADFAVYFVQVKNFGGYISMDFLNTASDADAWYVDDQGLYFIVLKMKKKIGGQAVVGKTIDNYLIIHARSGKIASITAALPGDAKPMSGGGGNTPKDSDGDGLADADDGCPDKYGPLKYGGCPDSDNDGLPDHLDNCPSQYGPRSNGGCPEDKPVPPSDRDGDGVPDSRDDCPDTYARTSNGCPAPPPPPKNKETYTAKGVSFNMVYVKAGTFTMGSPSSEVDRIADRETQHRVSLTQNYQMGEMEVTQELYQAVMGTNPSRFSNCPKCPVEQVSWEDAQAFIKKLNSLTGQSFRLPTEAEWEYAARAGTTTPFHTGNNITTDQANYDGNYPYNGNAKGQYRQKTTTVGSFAPNAWGLYDMSGNVWEWCQDWYGGDYPSGSVTNPTGPSSGSYRVVRGGGWYGYAENCRVARRSSGSPDGRNYTLGFRLAKTVSL